MNRVTIHQAKIPKCRFGASICHACIQGHYWPANCLQRLKIEVRLCWFFDCISRRVVIYCNTCRVRSLTSGILFGDVLGEAEKNMDWAVNRNVYGIHWSESAENLDFYVNWSSDSLPKQTKKGVQRKNSVWTLGFLWRPSIYGQSDSSFMGTCYERFWKKKKIESTPSSSVNENNETYIHVLEGSGA